MKKTSAILAVLALLAGCTIFKTVPSYTPDPGNAQAIRAAIENPVNIGEFTDASHRKELTCGSLAIICAPGNQTYADTIRHALIDELTQAGRYDTASPVTITAHLNHIGFNTPKGIWTIRMTLTSSNGKTALIEETHTYSSAAYGELACTQAAFSYQPILKKLIKNLLASPEFAALAQNTPPPAKTADPTGISPLTHTPEEKAEKAQAREAGKERIRQPASLEPTRKITANND